MEFLPRNFAYPKTVLWKIVPGTLGNIVSKVALNFVMSTKQPSFCIL